MSRYELLPAVTVQLHLADVLADFLHVLCEEWRLDELVHKGRGDGEEQVEGLLILPNDLDQVDVLADGTQLYNIVNVTDGDTKEEVHYYDWYDADEDEEYSLARDGEYIWNGCGLQCGGGVLPNPLCAVHQIIVIDFPSHHCKCLLNNLGS